MSLAEPTITKHGNSYEVSHGDDKSLFAEFSLEAIKNDVKSLEEGREIYEDKEFITIRFAGDKNTVRKTRVKPGSEWPLRFPRQWEAFKNQQIQVCEGTPITEWPVISKSEAMELKAVNIHTVEALAAVSDSNLKWMGARTTREKAINWLAQAKNGAGVGKLQAENQALLIQNEALKNQIEALSKLKEAKDVKDIPAIDAVGSKRIGNS